jgi:BirA family biotin operon repressor/biotin-[acetyl-CoA-carboxylase] ligase
MNRPFNVELFKSTLSTAWLGQEFLHLDRVDSTNSYLKNVPDGELRHGTVLLTDHQTGGRGQYKKQWHSGANKNLTFTIAFRPERADRMPLLTLSCANAVSSVLDTYSKSPVKLKWPNDLIIDDQKLGGILTECIFLGNKPDRILIGIGLNIYSNGYDGIQLDSAVCLEEVCREAVDIGREHLLSGCLESIEEAYSEWADKYTDLHKKVSKRLMGYGNWVNISIDGVREKGSFKFLGVNAEGEPIALNEELDVNTFKHGQVRIHTGS